MQVLQVVRRFSQTHSIWLYGAISAQIAAAALVLYLQNLFAEEQNKQNLAILQQVCGRTAVDIAVRARQHMDGAFDIVDVPQSVPQERNFQRDLSRLNAGIRQNQYVTQFFIWSDQFPPAFSDQVLFVTPNDVIAGSAEGRPAGFQDVTRVGGRVDRPLADLAGFASLPDWGRDLRQVIEQVSAERQNGSMWTYHAVDRRWGTSDYEVVMKFFFPTVFREQYIAVYGYTVDIHEAPRKVFDQLLAQVPSVLNPRPTLPQLNLTVHDERGRVVYGDPVPAEIPSASAPLDFRLFRLNALKTYLSSSVPSRVWTVTVSAPVTSSAVSVTRNWASGTAILLIVFAIWGALTSVKQARRLGRMQSDFVANVSHQLKTPLSVLAAASETLHRGRVQSPEKVREYAELARAQTVRLSRLIDRILSFSRAEVGTISNKQRLDLSALVERCVADFKRDLHDPNIQVCLERGMEPMTVNGDPDSLEQVVVNLIDNAVKYSRPGQTNLITVRVESHGSEALLIVTDTGLGIDKAEIAHIFDKFYRGRQLHHRSKGFGIGLAIVQAVVSAHDGSIAVKSELDKGSEFRVSLPRA